MNVDADAYCTGRPGEWPGRHFSDPERITIFNRFVDMVLAESHVRVRGANGVPTDDMTAEPPPSRGDVPEIAHLDYDHFACANDAEARTRAARAPPAPPASSRAAA